MEDPTDPSKTILKDTTYDLIIPPDDSYHDCLTGNNGVLAYTSQWVTNGNKKHTYIQLCKALLDDFGQQPTLSGMEFKVKQLNGAAEYMAQMRKAPARIDNFMPFYVTMFHEVRRSFLLGVPISLFDSDADSQFIHTWKVQDPEIEDTAGYGWKSCTEATEAQALDNADSYSLVALGKYLESTNRVSRMVLTDIQGAWILSTFGATISNQGIIKFDEYKDHLAKRDELVGLPWFA